MNYNPQQDYYYCSCGLSKNQPFCDGSHKGSGLVPKRFNVTEKKDYFLCGCKLTDNAPFCDGTHRKEKGVKKYNEFLLKENTKLKNRVAEQEKRVKVLGGVAVAISVVSVAAVVLSRVWNK
jgi:CDGSH-type Zn-finger protein